MSTDAADDDETGANQGEGLDGWMNHPMSEYSPLALVRGLGPIKRAPRIHSATVTLGRQLCL